VDATQGVEAQTVANCYTAIEQGVEVIPVLNKIDLPSADCDAAIEQIEDVDLDDLHPESLWKFRVKGFGPLLVSMDAHGGNLYTEVNKSAKDKRAEVLAALGVKSS